MLHREVEERDREREFDCAPHNQKTVLTFHEICYNSYKYQPPNNLANINIFTQEILYPSVISKKIDALHRKSFGTLNFDHFFSIFKSELCL